MLLTFQELVDNFFNNDNHWKNEDDKKIFSLRLKISYDLSKNRVKVSLDDREKQVNQYLEVTNNDDELELRTEILQLTQSIKDKKQDIKALEKSNNIDDSTAEINKLSSEISKLEKHVNICLEFTDDDDLELRTMILQLTQRIKDKKRDIKALEKSNNIDDSTAEINKLSSEISKLELNKDNKSRELYNTILNQEHKLQELIINFRGVIYDFFNKNTQWESEDDKKNFVWRLQIFYDCSDNRIKFNLAKRFKKIVSYLEAIINQISCFSSDTEIYDNADYRSYYGDDHIHERIYSRVLMKIIPHLIVDNISEYKNIEILSNDNIFNEVTEVYSKCFAMIFGVYIDGKDFLCFQLKKLLDISTTEII